MRFACPDPGDVAVTYDKAYAANMNSMNASEAREKLYDPFQKPPPFEKLLGDLKGAYSRRINIQHRLAYQVATRRTHRQGAADVDALRIGSGSHPVAKPRDKGGAPPLEQQSCAVLPNADPPGQGFFVMTSGFNS
jgi:Txe/YoeB family toxin of toxin-antitoxin system